MTADVTRLREMMVKLRNDAQARGMEDLALFYGKEAVRLSAQKLAETYCKSNPKPLDKMI